jgi:hypothetical protein
MDSNFLFRANRQRLQLLFLGLSGGTGAGGSDRPYATGQN